MRLFARQSKTVVCDMDRIGRDYAEMIRAGVLPIPSGWRLLCAVPETEKKYESGLLKADATTHYDSVLTTCLFVLVLGRDCYTDISRYPTGPWCKSGDFIMVRANTGTRFKVKGFEFRVINEDNVEGVIQDPRKLERAF